MTKKESIQYIQRVVGAHPEDILGIERGKDDSKR